MEEMGNPYMMMIRNPQAKRHTWTLQHSKTITLKQIPDEQGVKV
jgi:hypothetical protein